jgi:hypothetical protein
VGKGGKRGESLGSASSSQESRRHPQSGQAPQHLSTASDQVGITSSRPQASSSSLVDLLTARLSSASLHHPSQNASAINSRHLSVRAGTSRKDEAAQGSLSGSATTGSQHAHPVTTMGQDRPRARPTYLDAARPRTSSSAVVRREDFPPLTSNYTPMATIQPPPGRRGPFSESHLGVFQVVPGRQPRITLAPMGKDISTRRDGAQQQSARSLAPRSDRPGLQNFHDVGAGMDVDRSEQEAKSSRGHAHDSSVAPTGDQFFPPTAEGVILLPGYNTSEYRRERSPTSKVGIGIEAEFLLKSLRPENRRSSLAEFGEVVVAQHNSRMLDHHPGMDNNLHGSCTRTRFDKWALIVDASMVTYEEPCALSSFCLI